MKNIQADIKSGNFKQVYLLYGEEAYLKQQYKQNLVKALNPDGENGLQTKKQQATKSWIKTMDLRHRWTAVLRWQSLPWSVVKNWQII